MVVPTGYAFLMPSLDLLIKKHGEKIGREEYNRFHRDYRAKHKRKFRKYWRERRAAERARET